MEIGAFFILIVVAAVVAVGGFLLYGVAMKLRHDKLHPTEDKLDTPQSGERRPEHTRVSNEQRRRFIVDR
ncbi:MAG TPA: hypothetical protein VGO14_08655 [Solirubrobacteraceae bacterium]|jgi:hypothetical protein|nr:hypothetical protein [Solirubrobacteraceae bacterium]